MKKKLCYCDMGDIRTNHLTLVQPSVNVRGIRILATILSVFMTTGKASASFEETLSELEAIVNEMESGDLPLNKALEKFERGIALSRQGQQSLENAEQKVKILLSEQGEETLHPLPESEQL
jgi:exodeoxyribonuclease VII small subunit